MTTTSKRRRVRFDCFEVDLVTGELWRDNIRLRFGQQPFQVLKLLLERPGELITREELHDAMWTSDTFVDFEHGLNAAINKLRQLLNDDAEEPRYVETIPRRGYRFIFPVSAPSEIAASAATAVNPPAEAGRTVNSLASWHKIVAWAGIGAACVLATFFVYQRVRLRPKISDVRLVPFTTYPGYQLCPAFSPDGSRIAFAWNRHPATGYKDFDLYVKVMGSENLLQLTHQPSAGICPTWSPDGTRIAFIRWSGPAGDLASVRVIPALGGTEKELLSISNGNIFGPPVWSPDGKWVVFGASLNGGDSQWIRFVSIDSGEVLEIPHATGCVGENFAVFSQSGGYWAYMCAFKSGEEYGIFTAPYSGDPPKRVATGLTRFTSKGWPGGLGWTDDDQKLVVSRAQPVVGHEIGYELDEVSLADGSLQKLPFGEGAEQIAVSPHENKLAFVFHPLVHIGIWRKDLMHPETAAVNLVPSTQREDDAQYSPDMKHLAFTSSRDGLAETWMSDADGTNMSKLSDANTSDTGWPRWSPDSQKIVFSSHHSGHWEVYVVDIGERLPHKLDCGLPSTLVASWSHDGQWIYLQDATDERTYRCPATGGRSVAMSTATGLNPWESGDGKTLYFADRLQMAILKMVPLKLNGTESALPGMPTVFNAGSWAVARQGVYFVPASEPKSVRYFDVETRQVRPVFGVANFVTDLAVSRDARWITYTQLDQDNANIMLLENFH